MPPLLNHKQIAAYLNCLFSGGKPWDTLLDSSW